jgi:hypothetical protein
MFTHLAEIDSSGVEFEKVAKYDTLVFCCISNSASLCDPITLESLESLAILDKKYYAVARNSDTKVKVLALLANIQLYLELGDSIDFFLTIKSNSFIKGEPIGVSITTINYNDSEKPDDVFIRQLNLLRKEIFKSNQTNEYKNIAVNVVKKIYEIVISVV